ncbi:MAG: LuxR C-terminal-related transcriptional regulator, partial [Actinobacteria bacterium]|nr:LuxR C-terminal-related transcriptional regulator [Actinomycetota bacterium]
LFELSLARCTNEEYKAHLRPNLAWTLVLSGAWGEADKMLRNATRTAAATGDHWNLSGMLESSAKLQAWMGNLAEAFDLAQWCANVSTRLGNPADEIDAIAAMTLCFLEAEDPDSAAKYATQIPNFENQIVEPRDLAFTCVIVAESYLLGGEIKNACRWHAEATRRLSTSRIWEAGVDRLEAQIELARGNTARAIAILRPWIHAPSPVVFEQARILEVAAQAQWISGDRKGAVDRARESSAIYERLGAARRLQRINDWLATHSPRRRGRPRSSFPGGLTQREGEVLKFVAEGRTNREIALALTLSVGTVNKHVEHIIAKAGVSRRTELVAFANRLSSVSMEANTN